MSKIKYLQNTSAICASIIFLYPVSIASAADYTATTPELTATTTTQVNPNSTEWGLINLLPADTASAKGGAGVIVALLDGRSDCRDTDLAGHCSNILQPGGTYATYATHGTHTAGIVAGKSFGVAPSATIRNYAVYDDKGYVATTRLGDIWKAAYAAGARVANMSFGCAKTALCYSSNDLTAMAGATAAMVYVKSAGNDGVKLPNEFVPVLSTTATAALNRLILVGSVDVSGAISSFSNSPGEGCLLSMGVATCPEQMKWKYHFIVAPGRSIYSTLPGNSYGSMSGTSMAAPVVAGVVALLEQRWPALKDKPETTAQILFATATDKGAAGVDAVYGYGLLNASAAFQAYGAVAIVSPTGAATTLSGTTITATSSFAKIGQALGQATVYDSFGRDFSAAEAGVVRVKANARALIRSLGDRMLGSIGTGAWAGDIFDERHAARSFSMFGSPAGMVDAGIGVSSDRTARMGIDMPFEGGAAQFRLTGGRDARVDFAYDPSMKPLASFASTGLLRGAMISNALINLPRHSRLMVYGIITTGAVSARAAYDPAEMRLTDQGYMPRAALTAGRSEQKRSGIGFGYWTQPARNTVIGVNVSAIAQTKGYYTLATDLADLDRATNMVNLGVAASRKIGNWELSASGEITNIRMNGARGAIAFTTANFASGEISVRRTHIAFGGGRLQDNLGIALVVPPSAISGNMRVDYLTRTADGLGVQAAHYAVPISRLGNDPARVEFAYRLSSGSSWSFGLSGGVNLARAAGSGLGETRARLGIAL